MGMAASQGRLLFMTARLSNNEFEQQCVAYSKQRLADSSQKANDEYLEALKATSYQILTGYNGNDATYADVTYNQLTGYFGNSTIPLSSGADSSQVTGVAANKQYIVKDNKGQILVTSKIAKAFEDAKGDFNKFLENVGGLTVVKPEDISQQNVHEAWDKYLVSVGKGANTPTDKTNHILGFAYNREKNASGEYVDFASYTTRAINFEIYKNRTDSDGNVLYDVNGDPVKETVSKEDVYLNIDVNDNDEDVYFVNNYEFIAVPNGSDMDGNTIYVAAFQSHEKKGTNDYVLVGNPTVEYDPVKKTYTFTDADNPSVTGEHLYLGPNNTITTDYRTELTLPQLSATQEEVSVLFYEGTNTEQKELYDYAMAISREWATDPTQRLNYDAGQINYYKNIYNQMITGGYTTYQTMIDTKYMSSTQDNEKIAYQDENWFITQLKSGRLNISYYSAVEQEFVGTSLDDDESICEREDKSKIAIAEQQYNTTMDKIEAQDKQFDLTLNRLEAEHNALQTEYEAVSKVISKNVEKSFNIFNA